MLDNAYVEFAAARLSAFQGGEDWLIVFELLGFSTKEIEFVNDLYAFGSCVGREGFIGEEILFHSTPKQPLFDAETDECIVDWTTWAIRAGNEDLSFSPTREEYAEAGIVINQEPGCGSLREIELLRFLVHHLGEPRFFLADGALLRHFPKCVNLKKFIQTTCWQHPIVAEKEQPSKNTSIRSLIKALSQRNPALFSEGRPNTHWSYWLRAK